MDLYKLKRKDLDIVERDPFKLEKEIQALVEHNLQDLFGLTFVASEFNLNNPRQLRIDTLAFDSENNAFVVIEYKRGRNLSVIDQGFEYLAAIQANLADCILEFNEKQNENLSKKDIDASSSRVIFVAPGFNKTQKGSLNFKDLPVFELWEVNRYAGGLITFNKANTDSQASFKALETVSDPAIKKIASKISITTEEDHTKFLSAELKENWSTLREKLEDLPDTSLYSTKRYVAVKRGSKVFAYFYFSKKTVRVVILRGSVKEAEKHSNLFSLKDYKGIAKEHDHKYKEDRLFGYRINLDDDVDYIFDLIKQRYDSV